MSSSVPVPARIEASVVHDSETPAIPQWKAATRIAFRFCFAYFSSFCLTTQILGGLLLIPGVDFPDLASLRPVRPIVFWTAAHVFHVTTPLVYTGSGSGDKTFDWLLSFCLLIISAVATLVWSVLDRRRTEYVTLYKWFRLFLRFALASEMLLYGLIKIVPLQMPFPFLTKLVEPFGSFSPMGVLWSSVGASRAYEMFAGSAETLAGVLLIVPRTATLGALVCLADMIQVFTLNMSYDVPVKLFSFHLVVMAAFLLAPETQRLLNFFVLDRPAEPSKCPDLFRERRANRIAVFAQIIFGIWLIGMNVYGARESWRSYGGGAPKSELYGIWNIEQFTIDGQTRPPLITDNDRWRRLIFDAPSGFAIQRMDDSFLRYGSTINAKSQSIVVTKGGAQNWKASFSYERPQPTELALNGEMDGHKLHLQLKLIDRNSFLLVNRGFHWIQEYPFNR